MKSLEQHQMESTPALIANLYNSLSIVDKTILEEAFDKGLIAAEMLTRTDLNDVGLLNQEQMLELRHTLNEFSAVHDESAKRKLAQVISNMF